MERLKNIIRRLGLKEDETIINTERLKSLEDIESTYTKLKGLPLEQRIKEIQKPTKKSQPQKKRGGGQTVNIHSNKNNQWKKQRHNRNNQKNNTRL